MDTYKHQKYLTTPENVKKTVKRYGVAIVDNVLSESQCNNMLRGMWDSLEHLTQNMASPMDRNDQDTWSTFHELVPSHGMLLQYWGIGHAQFMWDIRQNNKIIDNYKHIWDDTDNDNTELLVSFDGASFNPPPEITNRGWHNDNNSWLHTDQSYTRNSFECVQSWVTACDVNKGDATLVFLKSSNKYHKQVAQEFEITDKADWYKLTPEQEKFYVDELGCEIGRIKCPKGSQVFWDSRTIHAGQGPMKQREKQNFRCVGYVCYAPRSLATNAFLTRKQKHFNEQRTMTHWPHRGKVFGKHPRTYGKPLPDINPLPPPILNDIGKRLAGF